MLYNSLSYCNLCDDKANDSESKPVEIDKLADDKGEAILSLEYILIQIMAFVCLFVCLFVCPSSVPLRVLLYAQWGWKFNHLECGMCVAAAMFVSLNVYLPPEPPLFVKEICPLDRFYFVYDCVSFPFF